MLRPSEASDIDAWCRQVDEEWAAHWKASNDAAQCAEATRPLPPAVPQARAAQAPGWRLLGLRLVLAVVLAAVVACVLR